MFIRSLAVGLVATSLLACAKPDAPSPDAPSTTVAMGRGSVDSSTSASPVRAEAHSMLKLDYTLTTTDPGKPPTTAEYTVNVEENQKGEVHVGRNITLQVAPMGVPSAPPPPRGPGAAPSGSAHGPMMGMSAPRMDVGMRLRCSYQMAGDDFTIHTDFEMSDIIEDGSPIAKIAKVTLKGDAPIKAGQSALVSVSEDPNSHRKYQLTVKATRLR